VKRGVTLAVMGTFGGFGAIVSSFSFVSSEAPAYRPGYIICLSFLGGAFVLTVIYTLSLWLDNRARDAGKYHPTNSDDDDLADRHVCPSSGTGC
jgi:hypothetical protein